MKKILVPTDFSVNSKAGVRFAIRWAARQKLELVFVHVLNVMRLTTWSDAYYEKYAAQEKQLCRVKFEKFIAGIYRQMHIKPGKHSFVIVHGISADISILDFCRKNMDIDCICISTRGAGKFKKIFGTNTGNLITKSAVPVLAVPQHYKDTGLRKILYATDLRSYNKEIEKVIAFAEPLKSPVDVVHFTGPGEMTFDEKTIEVALKRQFRHGLNLHFDKNDGVHSFVENLEKQISIRKPWLVVMFTNQKRTFIQKLFLSSKAEELSFRSKTPLLVFNKN